MKLKHLYVVLGVLGTILPYGQFVPWIVDNGLNVSLMVEQITSSRLAAFGWLDVIVSAFVLFAFVLSDGRKNGIRNLWLPIEGTLTVGVSLGLPLYLLLREVQQESAV